MRWPQVDFCSNCIMWSGFCKLAQHMCRETVQQLQGIVCTVMLPSCAQPDLTMTPDDVHFMIQDFTAKPCKCYACMLQLLLSFSSRQRLHCCNSCHLHVPSCRLLPPLLHYRLQVISMSMFIDIDLDMSCGQRDEVHAADLLKGMMALGLVQPAMVSIPPVKTFLRINLHGWLASTIWGQPYERVSSAGNNCCSSCPLRWSVCSALYPPHLAACSSVSIDVPVNMYIMLAGIGMV